MKMVAPHAGAWIEILKPNNFTLLMWVAPHAGAWIEIFDCTTGRLTVTMSPLTQGRGLKSH